MARHALVRNRRGRRTGLAAALLAGTVTLPLTQTASAAEPVPASAADTGDLAADTAAEPVAEPVAEAVVPATPRTEDLNATLFSPGTIKNADGAGAEGVFHRMESPADPRARNLVWTRYADGETFPVPAEYTSAATRATGSDFLARTDGDTVVLWDAAEGTSHTVRVPEGYKWLVEYGSTVVTYTTVTNADGSASHTMHLLTPGADGTTRDVAVHGLPAGSAVGAPVGGDATSYFFNGRVDGSTRVIEADMTTGEVRGWTAPLPTGYNLGAIGPGHVALYGRTPEDVLVLDRSDLGAAPTSLLLEEGWVRPADDLAVVGDWLVYTPVARYTGTVRAVPMAGGDAVTLVPQMNRPAISAGPGGTAVAIGKAADGEQALLRIAAGDDGRPAVGVAKRLPRPESTIDGVALTQGKLIVTDTSNGRRDDYVRQVDHAPGTGVPQVGERSPFTPGSDVLLGPDCPAADGSCSAVHGTTDGRILWTEHEQSGERLRVNGPGDHDLDEFGIPLGARVTDVSGQYVIYTAGTKQYVQRFGNSAGPTVVRDAGAAALWGAVLWTPGTTPGTVTATDLTTKATVGTVDTGAGCAPAELQALGRLLYWSCGPDGPAGVYDRTSKRTMPVPAGEALLGDGYVVTHDKAAGKLVLTPLGAAGAGPARTIGDLPDTGVPQRHVRWTVDKSGADIAYVDAQERVHLVPSGQPTSPLSLMAPPDNAASLSATTEDVDPQRLTTLLLSKPTSEWTLTVRSHATKAVVDIRSGGAGRGVVEVGWHGRDYRFGAFGDRFLPRGRYDWTLEVRPADGSAALRTTGSVRLAEGAPVRRDHAGPGTTLDGNGDLLTLNSSGAFTFQQGNGAGGFTGKTAASGWPTTTKAVPFGDLNGDNCNDVLVRVASGELRSYRPGCDKPLAPSVPYTKIGSGWNNYDSLVSPGDLNGDGLPDLLARKISTGDLYAYPGRSDGTLSTRTRIGAGWSGYTIAPAGDVNGDGIGDVFARRKDGTLFRYEGAGDGTWKQRTQLFQNWGNSYNAVIGVGDLTGDGRDDLIARDTSGNLYRYSGTADGKLTSRSRIAGGWNAYKGIF
ncbi:FG-GAP repeat domain-containing protein [Streptomyces albidoflavus]